MPVLQPHIVLDFDSYAVRLQAATTSISLSGHHWFVQNPYRRAVRAWYEAVPERHPQLPPAEQYQRSLEYILLQLEHCSASLIHTHPLHDATTTAQDLSNPIVVLHLTIDDIHLLRGVPIVAPFPIPVHVYIGDPLVSTTPMNAYSPDKLTIPPLLEPGDPLFCTRTKRVMVLGAYLHSTQDDALYGLTVGHAVESDPYFVPHRKLPAHAGQRHTRGSRHALQSSGTALSSPAPSVVESAVRAFDDENATREQLSQARDDAFAARQRARTAQEDTEIGVLRAALTRPHDLDVGHACAAEAIIRPCEDPDLHAHAHTHTHLLSWTLLRIARPQADNALVLHAYPGALARGAPVALHVRDPHRERPLGPHRDAVVNGAPASVVHRGFVAREWAVFPAAARRGLRVAARGDAGALVLDDAERPRALALLYALPQRGPYALVTPLSTVLRRVRDVTGLQLRFQGRWWRDNYS